METLRSQQQRIASLEHRLNRIQSVITSARCLQQAAETLSGKLGLFHEEDRKLAAGEEPLDVIAWVDRKSVV